MQRKMSRNALFFREEMFLRAGNRPYSRAETLVAEIRAGKHLQTRAECNRLAKEAEKYPKIPRGISRS